MGLSSVASVALSGMQAATTFLNVTGNNLANSQTPSFKASRVELATQAYQTLSPGGLTTNPVQTGLGVVTAAISMDWSGGSIKTNDPLPLLALDGEGLFILEGDDGERFYTRRGDFRLNAVGELTLDGRYRVLGYAQNEQGQLDESQLAPLTIRLGSQVADENGNAISLQSYGIASDGRVLGKYSNGSQRTLGQIRIARFANPYGLYQRTSMLYSATASSGMPLETNPGVAGGATILSGATEHANVDVGRELVQLALAKTQFRANLLVMETSFEMLDSLLNLRRYYR